MYSKNIEIISKRNKYMINASAILYVLMNEKYAEIHVSGGNVYYTRKPLHEFEVLLGDLFVKINRGCLVSALAVHEVGETIILVNGESLIYTLRKKKVIIQQINKIQKSIINGFEKDGIPKTFEEYKEYYKSFEHMPFAFTDIEMVFNEHNQAVDWIFCYGNQSLANLEKMPLENLIGNSFNSLFSNMDSKWLNCYEQVTLYRKTIEIMDYSPEIDTYLKVICFPTFKGHCGCILFDLLSLKLDNSSEDATKALKLYLDKNDKNR